MNRTIPDSITKMFMMGMVKEQSKEKLDEMKVKFDLASKELNTPNWDIFKGNNHARISNPLGIKYGGGVYFTRHIGKPLNNQLWEDLVCRLQVHAIRIYGPDDCQWCDAPSSIAYIYLDKDEKVRDIYYVP